MSSQSILIVGGAGFIGSYVAKMLDMQGYSPIVFDNLSLGNPQAVKRGPLVRGDLASFADLENVFNHFDISAVMHFGALIDVGESVVDPSRYYINNVSNTLNLLEAMRRHNIKTLIFSSSAAIFGNPQHPFIAEDHPCHPINPYGKSKLIIEQVLHDYDLAYGIKSSCLRYFNATGGDPEKEIKTCKRKETNLIPLVLRSLKQRGTVTIFGTDYPTPDGTCIRDYIHIDDLGSAHILSMEKLFRDRQSSHYNLGNGNGFSVCDVIRTAETVTSLKVDVVEGPRRPGDPPVLVADPQKAQRELGWIPRYSNLEVMIDHAWQVM